MSRAKLRKQVYNSVATDAKLEPRVGDTIPIIHGRERPQNIALSFQDLKAAESNSWNMRKMTGLSPLDFTPFFLLHISLLLTRNMTLSIALVRLGSVLFLPNLVLSSVIVNSTSPSQNCHILSFAGINPGAPEAWENWEAEGWQSIRKDYQGDDLCQVLGKRELPGSIKQCL